LWCHLICFLPGAVFAVPTKLTRSRFSSTESFGTGSLRAQRVRAMEYSASYSDAIKFLHNPEVFGTVGNYTSGFLIKLTSSYPGQGEQHNIHPRNEIVAGADVKELSTRPHREDGNSRILTCSRKMACASTNQELVESIRFRTTPETPTDRRTTFQGTPLREQGRIRR